MAYGVKSKYKRKFARKGRVAKLARGKSSKIQTLAKAVSRIQRSMRTKCEYLNYVQQGVTGVSGNFLGINLSDYANWTRIFGTSSNDDTGNKVVHKSFGMDLYLSLENTVNEPDTTQFTCFLVSLKDPIGSAFNPLNGSLFLSVGSHYVVQGGIVMLNKKCFTIHKTKRIVLTNHGTSLANPSAQTQYGTDCRWYWKYSPNTMIQNPIGDWKSMNTAQDPSKQYYLLIFNDNSSADLQSPTLHSNIVHTVQTVA